MTVLGQVRGCLIRIESNDKDYLEEISSLFERFGIESEVIDRQDNRDFREPRYHVTFERNGNLDMQGWLATFARDLEEFTTDEQFLLKDDLTVNIKVLRT